VKRYITIGLIVFLGVVIVTFPARVAYNWFAPPEIQLTGISGSIWNGAAVEGLAAGAYIQDIAWKLKPASILSGQLAFATSGRPGSGSLAADVAASVDGSLILSNINGRVPLDLVHPAFQQNRIRGDVTLIFDSLILRDGMPVDVVGTVTIANLFAPNLSSARLGDYKADFRTENGTVMADVSDVSGVLDVSGQISLSPDRSFQLLGEVAARPDAPPSVSQQLQFLGSADERGFRPFRFEGSL
jgi:general secretion pathway protein N